MLHATFFFLSVLELCSAFQRTSFFGGRRSVSVGRQSTSSLQAAVDYDTVAEVGFRIKVDKPMGVIFGENPEPYFGLSVDDVSEGLNGGMAGIRQGDQLLSVGKEVVLGKDFDTVMSMLQGGPQTLELTMYRGTISTLYTILGNKLGEDAVFGEDDDGEEPIIMDENYESPVKVEVREKKKLTPGDFFKAAKKVAEMLTEDDSPKPEGEKKKSGGFFGIGAESVQLDGEDAKGYK
jgi:hypothetical protein